MKTTILSCLLLVSISGLVAQSNTDIQLLHQVFETAPKNRLVERFSESKQNKNELQLLLSGLFLTYKSFISSQDQNRCSFTPSCSEYGLLAVKKLGIIKGGISTMDRLTRCNGLNAPNYKFDPKSFHLIDYPTW